jgi:thiosulfate dehydrogenase
MQENQQQESLEQRLISIINRLMMLVIVLIIGLISIPAVLLYKDNALEKDSKVTTGTKVDSQKDKYWKAPDITELKEAKLKKQIEYGKELIGHTSKYLGPHGTVQKISNGMNCQNCHLDAGTKVFGNNYGSVASTYPKFRPRSGTIENIYKRVNDCFERSLNGKALDTMSAEMQAIAAYINFLGSNVQKGKKAEGSGFKDLAYMDRSADPLKGKSVYVTKCQSCHQADGGGLILPDSSEYSYPPLWGPHSYNDAAGLYRISNFAKYVKYNMPQGTNHDSPSLTDEEAWDVAAFVNSQDRPHLKVPADWPDIAKKPIDHPFGPFADSYSEQQHKYGPFKKMAEERKKKEEKKSNSKK